MPKTNKPIECDFALWVECSDCSETLYDISPTREEALREKARLEASGTRTVKIVAQPKSAKDFERFQAEANPSA